MQATSLVHSVRKVLQLYMLHFPLAAESSADVSNVSEVDSSPLGMYNYVVVSTSSPLCVINSPSSREAIFVKTNVDWVVSVRGHLHKVLLACYLEGPLQTMHFWLLCAAFCYEWSTSQSSWVGQKGKLGNGKRNRNSNMTFTKWIVHACFNGCDLMEKFHSASKCSFQFSTKLR